MTNEILNMIPSGLERDPDLLPCPFCGKPAFRYPDGPEEGFSIMCDTQGCAQNTFGYATDKESVEAWNMRDGIKK